MKFLKIVLILFISSNLQRSDSNGVLNLLEEQSNSIPKISIAGIGADLQNDFKRSGIYLGK